MEANVLRKVITCSLEVFSEYLLNSLLAVVICCWLLDSVAHTFKGKVLPIKQGRDMDLRERVPTKVGMERKFSTASSLPRPCYFSFSVILSFVVSGEELGETACKDWYQFTPKQNSVHPAQGIGSNIHKNLTKCKSTQTLSSALASMGRKSIYIGSYEVSKTFWISTPWLPAVDLKIWNKT